MKILIVTSGSRGDCQPFIALGSHLKKVNHQVLLVTNPDHVDLCKDMDVDCKENASTRFESFFTSAPCRKAMENNNFLAFLDAMGKYHQGVLATIYETLYEAISSWKPDLVLCGTMHWQDAAWIPNLLQVPAVPYTLTNSMSCNPDIAPFGLPSLPFSMNRPIWHLVFWKYGSDLSKAVGGTLERLSGRKVADFFPTGKTLLELMSGRGIGQPDPWSFVPLFIMEDASLHEGGKKYDLSRFTYTGSCHVPPASCTGKAFGGEKAALLDEFVASCPEPPVYIGWGSISSPSAEWQAQFAVQTLLEAGCKGVVCGGWGHLNESMLATAPNATELQEYADKNVFFIDAAPHEVLFPRCSVIIHHGGASTTEVAMRSGKPQIVTPVFYDQFDNAAIVNSRGVGVGTSRQLNKLAAKEVAAIVQDCRSDVKMQEKARAFAAKLTEGDACELATSAIETFYTEQVKSGTYWKGYNALMKETVRKPWLSFLGK